MIFKDYINAYAGQTAWIFGKGPSLEMVKYLDIPMDDIRIAINEACNVVDVDFVFVHDSVTLPFIWGNPCLYVLEHRFKEFVPEEELNHVVFYNKYQHGENGKFSRMLRIKRETMQEKEMLIGMTGTAHSAFHFCHYTGIKNVILVGFDFEANGLLYDGLGEIAEYSFPKVYEEIYHTLMDMANAFEINVKRIRYD